MSVITGEAESDNGQWLRGACTQQPILNEGIAPVADLEVNA